MREHRFQTQRKPPRDVSGLPWPQSLEAERAVLGSLLLLQGDQAAHDVVARLTPDAFYSGEHAKLYELLASQIRANRPMDVVGLADHLMLTETAGEVGGLSYATSLPEHVPTTENVLYYVGLMLDKHKRRRLLEHAATIRQMVFDERDADAIAVRIAEQAERLCGEGVQAASDDQSIDRVGGEFFVRIYEEKNAAREGRTMGLPLGFHALDKMTYVVPGDMVYLVGRPAMGKTQLLLQVLLAQARYIAERRLPGVVYVCSMEMTGHQLLARLVSLLCGVPYKAILNPTIQLNDEQMYRIERASEELRALPIVINDRPRRNMADVRRSVHALARQHGAVHAVGLDFIQLVDAGEDAAELRSAELTKIAYAAKAIAKDFRTRFFAVAQLNRGVESRQNKRPMLSDMNESGGLEQSADVVLAVYRDEYYNPGGPDRGIAEVLCLKVRNGEVGTGRMRFKDGFFADLDAESTHKYHGGW